VQLNLCRSQNAKTLLSHPFGAWLLLFPGFVAALGKGMTITCERRLVLHPGRFASSAGRMAAGARRRTVDVVASPSKTCNNALVVMRPARREPLPWPLALLRFLPREQTIVCKARLTRCARPSGQPAAVTALRFVYSLRSPFGPACGCYCAALRLLAALALRASLRLLLRCASFTRCARPSGQPAAVTALRFVYSLRSPFGPACGCYCAALRLLAALALRASLRLLLRFATFTRNQGRGSDDAN